ncbi:WD40 repeat domain-containing protein [Lyngbya aestuarii]|uniref:WD40 repeat domain-containing protein n=1 Tax=Lyngbya aestuarii TaxID=118322 RepID=UPI00403E1305
MKILKIGDLKRKYFLLALVGFIILVLLGDDPLEVLPFVQQKRMYCSHNQIKSPYCDFSVVRTLEGHPTAFAIVISYDGNTLISGGKDKAIKVWDLQTGQLRKTLQSDSGEIQAVAIAPDGKTVVSGSGDRLVRIWDITSDKPPRLLTGHSGNVTHVDISSDGKTIISLDRGRDPEIKVWDLATGEQKARLPYLHFDDISPDGKTVLFTSPASQLIAWDVTTNQQQVLQKFFRPLDSARIGLDGHTLISLKRGTFTKQAKRSFDLKISDLTTGKVKTKERFSRWMFKPSDIALSRNFMIGSTLKGLAVWNLQTAKLEATLNKDNFNKDNLSNLVVSPDGKLLVGITGNSDSYNSEILVLQRP